MIAELGHFSLILALGFKLCLFFKHGVLSNCSARHRHWHSGACFEDSYARVIGEGVGLGDKGYTFFRMFYDVFFSKSQQIRDKFADVAGKENSRRKNWHLPTKPVPAL